MRLRAWPDACTDQQLVYKGLMPLSPYSSSFVACSFSSTSNHLNPPFPHPCSSPKHPMVSLVQSQDAVPLHPTMCPVPQSLMPPLSVRWPRGLLPLSHGVDATAGPWGQGSWDSPGRDGGSGYWGSTTALVPLGSFARVEISFISYNRKRNRNFHNFFTHWIRWN